MICPKSPSCKWGSSSAYSALTPEPQLLTPLTPAPVLFGSVFPPGSLRDGLLNLSGIWPGLLSGGEGTQEFTTVTAVRGRDMGGRQEGLGTELGLWAQLGT